MTEAQSEVAGINYWLAASAALAVLTAAVHVLAGTPEIQGPLLGASFERPVTLELYAAWHLVSVALIVSAGVLVWAAWKRRPSDALLVAMVSALWLLFAAVFVVVDLLLAGSTGLLAAPQWTILLAVGVLGFVGASGLSRRAEQVPA
jgi:hypothetical protein